MKFKFYDKLNIALIIFFLAFIVFLIKGFIVLDPDFGWRVRAGIMYREGGIPNSDPFTFTMPSFAWVDHAWLISLIIGNLYSIVGKEGLSIIFSLIAFFAIFISVSISKVDTKKYFEKKSIFRKSILKKLWMFLSLPVIFFVGILFPYFSVRAQVITWLFLSIFLKVIFDEKLWNKWKYFIPPLFLIWANFHGGFASGLAVFLLILFVRTIVKKRINISDFLIFSVSVLLSFINPYGLGAFREVYSSISDSSLRWSIVEWMPAVFNMNFSFVALCSLSFVLIFKYRKKYPPEQLVLYVVLLLNALSSSRHVPLWAIIATPMTIGAIDIFFISIKKNKIAKQRFQKVYKTAFTLFLFTVIFQIGLTMYKSLIIYEDNFYPKKAIEYLSENKLEGRLFSEYGWGGYLIWKYPEKKVFIDGRMPSWKWINAPENESSNAFDDYMSLLSGKTDYKDTFGKFSIDTVLWPKEKPMSSFDSFKERMINVFKKYQKDKLFNFTSQLLNDGWNIIYEDEISTIFQKPS